MKQHITFLLFALGLLILMGGAVAFGFSVNEIYFLKPKVGAEQITITIPRGASVRDTSRSLAEQKLISSPFLFTAYIKFRGLERKLQEGAFSITRGTSMRSLAELLTEDVERERTITIIEGWTLTDIARYLTSIGIPENDFYRVAGAPTSVDERERTPREFAVYAEYPFLNMRPASASLEGFLFPDTYRIFEDATAEDVVRKMLENFSLKVGEVSYDDLILASIVESEVRGDADRRLVADIFKRRLEIGMAIQADSTVNYVIGKNARALPVANRELDSPYNTYRYPGLPPGPIANPGLSSIGAVRNPKPNSYWYFLTDSEGMAHYGRTLEEHNRNIARYLR